MSLSKNTRETDELVIIKLVSLVREYDNEQAFQALRKYLNYYIKLFSRKYRIAGCDPDEIEQECLCALRYKAIEDFNASRGKFKSFAILCIKRHLFSIIKGNNQQKRRTLNESLSLNEDHSDGDSLSIGNLIAEDVPPVDEQIEKDEAHSLRKIRLLAKSSELERVVCELYLKQFKYDEIVHELGRIFPDCNYDKKAVDNSLQRLRIKTKFIKWDE